MCRFKSGIILKNRVVLSPENNESHSRLLESLKIEDNEFNASHVFVRVELIPKDGNRAADIKSWKYVVDQDIVPDWYETDPERYENEFRDKVKEYLKGKFEIFAGYAWNAIKQDENKTIAIKAITTIIRLFIISFQKKLGRSNHLSLAPSIESSYNAM